MKVAHVVSVFPPYRSGLGNAAYQLCWELSAHHDVSVYTLTPNPQGEVDSSLPFTVHRLRPLARYGNAGFAPQLLWQLSGYDLVHLHYPFFGGAEMLYFRDRFFGLPLVLHYHMDVVGEGVWKRFFSWHSGHIMPRIVARAERIIVTTFDYAQQSNIKEVLLTHPEKFRAIPLGVNVNTFKPRIKHKPLLSRHNLHNKRVILFVAALDRAHYFKGVNYLIKAFQLISSNDEYRLVIVGTGNLQSSYESIVTNYGLNRKVIFTGSVSDDVLPLYYNVADVFVLPSIDSSEAFGMSLLEAMASALPVVASDLPGVRSIVERGKTGVLIKPKQVDLLAKQMLYLLKNPQVRNRFGSTARERVLAAYTWPSVGRQVESLYDEIQQ